MVRTGQLNCYSEFCRKPKLVTKLMSLYEKMHAAPLELKNNYFRCIYARRLQGHTYYVNTALVNRSERKQDGLSYVSVERKPYAMFSPVVIETR